MTGLVPVVHVGPRSAGERFVAAARFQAGLTQQAAPALEIAEARLAEAAR
jgi:hypothetical protein